MGTIHLKLTGRSPLLLHNIRLADPDDPISKEIAAITKKANKTEEDRKVIGRLEWFGSLYTSGNEPATIMPTANLRKCFIQAAKITKQGTQLGRALYFSDLDVPIVYEGPRELDKLYDIPAFRHRCAVGVSGKRTMRTRPAFRQWTIEALAEVIEDVIDLDAVRSIIELAGRAEGLGDNRINGYGRFEGVVNT